MFVYRAGSFEEIFLPVNKRSVRPFSHHIRNFDRVAGHFSEYRRSDSFFATPFLRETLRWADLKVGTEVVLRGVESLDSRQRDDFSIWKLEVDPSRLQIHSVDLYDEFAEAVFMFTQMETPESALQLAFDYWCDAVPLELLGKFPGFSGYNEILFQEEDLIDFFLVEPDELREASASLGDEYGFLVDGYAQIFPTL